LWYVLILFFLTPLLACPDEPKADTRTDFYGDPLPARAIARMGTTRLRLPNTGLVSLAFSPDGKILATGADNTLRLWSVSDGRLLAHIQGNYEGGTILFSADSKWLATVAEQAICRLDTTTGKLLQRIPVEGGELAVSPDGKLFAITWKDGAISVGNTADGKEIHHWSESKRPAILVHFASDGKFLVAMTRDKKFHRWDLAKAKLDKTIELTVPTWQHLQISPDGKFLALIPTNGTSAQIWDIEGGDKKYALSGDGVSGRLGLAFSPDGKKLATDWRDVKKGESGIAVWDANNGQLIRRISMTLTDQISLRFAPDNQTLATFTGGVAVQLWDTSTGKPRLDLAGHTVSINSLSFTPDGRYLVSAAESIELWETATGRHVRPLISHRSRYLGGSNIAAVLPNGREVLSTGADGTLLLQEIETAREIRRFPVQKQTPPLVEESWVSRLALSPDGTKAVSFSLVPKSRAARLEVWELAKDKPVLSRSDNSPVGDFPHLSADGRLLARYTGASRGTMTRPFRPGQPAPAPGPAPGPAPQVEIQDAATGKIIMSLPQPGPTFFATAFTPDSQVLATTTFKQIQGPIESRPGSWTIHLWELLSGKEQQSIPLGDEGESHITQMAFAPKQRALATARQVRTKAGDFENVIQFWDVATANQLLIRKGLDAEVRSLMFSADGKFLASGHADGSILIWEAPSITNSQSEKKSVATAQQLESRWADLADEDARKAGSAIWGLVDAGQPAVDLLRRQVHPATRTPVEQIKHWIADLDSNDFQRREDAVKQLADLEEVAQPALIETLNGKPSAEQRRRIKPLLEPSLLVRLSEKRRQLRSVQVLERIGSPEAQKVLTTLAQGGPEARLTIAAKAALERLNRGKSN
jgi:WD40 repeat protein